MKVPRAAALTIGLALSVGVTTAATAAQAAAAPRHDTAGVSATAPGRDVAASARLKHCVPPEDLTEEQASDLSLIRDEERMALDIYTLFSDTYEDGGPGRQDDGTGIFGNIADSEQRHTDTVLAMLEKYCLPDPAWHMDSGEYVEDVIQNLYDTWTEQGLESLEGALQVGVDLETRDIADLQALIDKVNPADIEQVYTNLQSGSYDHLESFSKALEQYQE